MIGKPEWFTYRIFGWGLRPKTWQGWVYVAAAAFLLGGVLAAAVNTTFGAWAFGIVMAILLVDTLHIMTRLSKTHDERENLHQLIIERNCSYAAIISLLGIAIYQSFFGKLPSLGTAITFDASLAFVLGAMVLTKAFSTWYTSQKM